MAEGELRIKSDSIEKTTSAITALIGKLEELDKNLDKVAKSSDSQASSQNKANTALKSAEIARKKAVEMLDLHKQGLGKLSDAYAEEQAAIKAREIAAKKNIEVGSEEYQQLLDNVKATELASTASKRLAAEEAEKAKELTRAEKAAKQAGQSTTKKTAAEIAAEKALNSSNISRETSIKLLKLEEKGLDRLSDEYAEQKGAILGAQQAKLKGIKSGTDEYKQIVKNTTAIEKSTAARKRLQAAEAKGTKGANGFTDSLDDMAKQAALVDGPLGGIASRITTLSAILKSTGGVGGALALTGVGVGLAVLTQQLVKGIGVAIDSEVSMKTLEAQIRATGGAAGYTAEQLDTMARSIARSTLDSTEGVRESIQSLLSFTNISSSMFEDVVRKAQDAAIVTGKSTKTVVSQLGKILDDPINNLETLKELRLSIAPEEKEAIKNLQSEGRLYEAQSIILEKVAKRYGDVARAQADTLAGDLDTVNQQWTELFETLGRGSSGPLRSVVQNWSNWLEVAQRLSETNVETTVRLQSQELEGLTTTSEETSKQLKIIESRLKELDDQGDNLSLSDYFDRATGSVLNFVEGFSKSQLALYGIGDGVVDLAKKQDRYLTDAQKEQIALLKIQEALLEKQKMQNGSAKEYIPLLTEAQQKARDLAETELSKQKNLTRMLIETGNTRNKSYRDAKAAQDALTEAQKRGLVVDEESLKKVLEGGKAKLGYQEKELKAIYENMVALSDLTEQRVSYNTILQKTKSLQSQQSGMEKEIALYKATTSGILENSEAYIQLSASLKTANEIKQMGGELSSEQARALYQENLETLKLQKNITVLNALKAGDSNSANVSTLKRQIELQELLSSGVRKNSEEYIRQEERLKALEVVRRNNVAVGSEEYNQLLANAEAMAGYRSQLQKTQELADLGIVVRFDGLQQIEGSLSQIASAKAEALSNVQELVNSGEINSQEIGDKIKQQLSEYFTDEANAILLPLGFSQDLEGNQFLTESVEAVEAEYAAKQKELEDARKEGIIADKQAFDQRMLDVEMEYQDKLAAMKIATWEKTAEAQALARQGEVAGLVKDGAKMISAVAGNSKKLMKISKAAAIFETSAALVQSIAKASAVGWPTNIPLIAEAFATGTQLVGQARSLNEPSFAFGGVDIQGAGTGRSDSIKANIARGESVMTAPATARYKDTLQRMNAGLPVKQGGGSSFVSSPTINIQGDASERTVGLIEMKLRDYEDRVQQIAQGVSQQTIQEENEVGGFLNPI